MVGLVELRPAPAESQTALDSNALPPIASEPDTVAVELGLRFTPTADGTVDAVRFYKGPQNAGPHTGSLWTGSGALLAQTTFENETASGWQTAELPTPVRVSAGASYVVSYHAPTGGYSSDADGFVSPSTRRSIDVPAAAGVYGYGDSGFPTETWRNSNYFVDLTFTPLPSAKDAAPPTREVPRPAPDPNTTTPGTLRPVDGGADYFDRFTNSLPTDPAFFPIGVWYESVLERRDIRADSAAGLNLYVELTADSDTSLLGDDGPYAITSGEMAGISGRITTDEADMWGGPGSAAWTGNYPGEGPICAPETSACGYTIMEEALQGIPPDTLTYSNYGKGVTFWGSDRESARFVNDYQDVVSADNYWFTDPNICGPSEGGQLVGGRSMSEDECRLAANYGWTVDRVRSLVEPAGSKPVWAFVEVGHPASEDFAPTISGPQIRAAVWSSIIHGARGVVYFNHNFGGDCISQHVLRDRCGTPVREAVSSVNAQITKLARVLNAPFIDGVTTAPESIDHMTKLQGDRVYIFAAAARSAPQTATISNECLGDGPISVVGENRTVPVTDGQFSDEFSDGNAVHIYSAAAGSRCAR